MLPAAVREAFEIQRGNCARMGAPFTAHLCARLPGVLDDRTATGRRVRDWPEEPVLSALALRLCGALHRLVRAGQAPALAALYPPVADRGPALDTALRATIAERDDDIVGTIAGPPQTNEVGRSACLVGGLMATARETGVATFDILEIGSSAGLNLAPDRYAYDLGDGRRWGPEGSPVRLACTWRGPAPEVTEIAVRGRAGCDVAPLDASDPADRERLLSYIWPDQPARLARTEAALALAAAAPPPVERAEAADWLEARLSRPAADGIARVLMHSVVWQYLPQATQTRISAAMALSGAGATARRPLAWIRLERDGTPGSAALIRTLWPGGETRVLARCDYHGAWADWLGTAQAAA